MEPLFQHFLCRYRLFELLLLLLLNESVTLAALKSTITLLSSRAGLFLQSCHELLDVFE